jgi:hypothetical protein
MLMPRLETINPNEVLLYLGYKGGDVPEDVEESIARCSAALMNTARPRLTYRIFPIKDGRPEGVGFSLKGEDIQHHLEFCTHAVFMAATLGPDVETLLMRKQVTDMAEALILDSCASTAIENICDNFEGDLRAEYAAQGLFLTDRFSPGYGDMPISQQTDFCEAMDTRRRIGLTVSQSGIMIPRKSVTAILGVSPVPKTRRSSGCARCTMFRSCQIRKSGRVCGK